MENKEKTENEKKKILYIFQASWKILNDKIFKLNIYQLIK